MILHFFVSIKFIKTFRCTVLNITVFPLHSIDSYTASVDSICVYPLVVSTVTLGLSTEGGALSTQVVTPVVPSPSPPGPGVATNQLPGTPTLRTAHTGHTPTRLTHPVAQCVEFLFLLTRETAQSTVPEAVFSTCSSCFG